MAAGCRVMKVVSFFKLKEVRWAIAEQDLAAIRAELPQVEIRSVEDEAQLPAALADADAFVGWTFPAEFFGACETAALGAFGERRGRGQPLSRAGRERR